MRTASAHDRHTSMYTLISSPYEEVTAPTKAQENPWLQYFPQPRALSLFASEWECSAWRAARSFQNTPETERKLPPKSPQPRERPPKPPDTKESSWISHASGTSKTLRMTLRVLLNSISLESPSASGLRGLLLQDVQLHLQLWLLSELRSILLVRLKAMDPREGL